MGYAKIKFFSPADLVLSGIGPNHLLLLGIKSQDLKGLRSMMSSFSLLLLNLSSGGFPRTNLPNDNWVGHEAKSDELTHYKLAVSDFAYRPSTHLLIFFGCD